MFSHFSTKSKLLILPVLFIFIAIITGSIYTYHDEISNSKNSNSKITDEMIQDILTGRLNVYQFLRNPNNENIQNVKKTFEDLNSDIDLFIKKLDLEEDIKIAKKIQELSKLYIISFENFSYKRVQDFQNGIKEESPEILANISVMIDIGTDLERKLDQINMHASKQAQEAKSTLSMQLLIIAIISILLFVTISLLLTKNILSNINNFQDGLVLFFKYLNNETDNVELLNDKNTDEFGEMAKIVNDNIKIAKTTIDQDRKIINESVKILTEYQEGDFNSKIDISSSNESLNQLTKMINHMSANLEKNIDLILTTLDEYSNSNYKNKVPTDGIRGHLEQLATGVNTLGDNISQLLKRSLEIGITLDNSSDILIENVNNLNNSANSAAASLEQTAAALEEITSAIVSNGENIHQMNQYTDDLNLSAKEGQNLAHKTTVAMEDINQQVSSINEAITVIDQIAFQTNILSLNAAVEAATAGEAGKGFAVVAQEVRNLASRSAEAAKEIKDLVENATSKANEGKSISANMIAGYNSLLENIDNSTQKITEIANASKEQESGITQINDAISLLDKQTQENASIANKTRDIAQDTDRIAKEIVTDAQSKEFIGKDEINIKKDTANKTNLKTNTTKKEAVITNEQITKSTDNQTFKPQNNNDDEWESF